MAAREPGRNVPDQRKFFRFPVAKPRREAVLKVGQTEVPVRLLDESAGGFTVLADRRPELEVGDVARLTRASDSYEVRIVDVQRAGGTAVEATEGRFRLGLERLRDLESWEGLEQGNGWIRRLFVRGRVAMGGSFAMVGVGLGIVVVAAAATALWTSGADDSLLDRLAGGEGASPVWRQRPAASSPQAIAGTAADSGEAWSTTVRRLPGATAFVLEDVIDYLALSESQQEQIRRIVEATAERAQLRGDALSGASRQERAELRRRLHDEAREQVLAMLTDEQRGRWDALQAADSQ